jgi:hypothetical protein
MTVDLMNRAGLEGIVTMKSACISIDHTEIDLHSATLVRQILFRQCRLCYSEALIEGVEVDRHVELCCRSRRRVFLSKFQRQRNVERIVQADQQKKAKRGSIDLGKF